jgi:uncharacterized membrane protein YfcA
MIELSALNFSFLLFFGVAIGLAGSALGIGGGIFMVPFLVLALKIPIHQAVAASLVAIVATSSAVAAVNVERGLANIRLGVTLEVTTALGSIAGALAAGRLPAGAMQLLFALMLFPVAALMFLKGKRSLQMPRISPRPRRRAKFRPWIQPTSTPRWRRIPLIRCVTSPRLPSSLSSPARCPGCWA